jgi:hypothetical protein
VLLLNRTNAAVRKARVQGCWPEPYICTVYDRVFGDFPAKSTVCTPYIYMANPSHFVSTKRHGLVVTGVLFQEGEEIKVQLCIVAR